MKRTHSLLLSILCSTLMAAPVFAGKDVIVERLGDEGFLAVDEAIAFARQDCQVGNLNPASWAITDWIWGQEGYSHSVWPELGCTCPLGFEVQTIHMAMQFGAEDVPATFDVYVDAEEAIHGSMPVYCPRPGPAYCVSDVFTIQIDTPGLYDIAIPISCECAFMPYLYMLSFYFVTSFDPAMRPDLITDDSTEPCLSYNDYGAGWEDLVNDLGLPGNALIWADVACCEQPVEFEVQTWGAVKDLYR